MQMPETVKDRHIVEKIINDLEEIAKIQHNAHLNRYIVELKEELLNVSPEVIEIPSIVEN